MASAARDKQKRPFALRLAGLVLVAAVLLSRGTPRELMRERGARMMLVAREHTNVRRRAGGSSDDFVGGGGPGAMI